MTNPYGQDFGDGDLEDAPNSSNNSNGSPAPTEQERLAEQWKVEIDNDGFLVIYERTEHGLFLILEAEPDDPERVARFVAALNRKEQS